MAYVAWAEVAQLATQPETVEQTRRPHRAHEQPRPYPIRTGGAPRHLVAPPPKTPAVTFTCCYASRSHSRCARGIAGLYLECNVHYSETVRNEASETAELSLELGVIDLVWQGSGMVSMHLLSRSLLVHVSVISNTHCTDNSILHILRIRVIEWQRFQSNEVSWVFRSSISRVLPEAIKIDSVERLET